MTNFGDLDAMDEDDWDKVNDPTLIMERWGWLLKQCWSVNLKSNFHLFKAALPTFNANPEGGAFLITSSIAVRRRNHAIWPDQLVGLMSVDWNF